MFDLKFYRVLKNLSTITFQKYKELLKINDGATLNSTNKNIKNNQLKYMETFYKYYCISHINYFKN